MRPLVRPTGFDRMLAPLHRWIWRDHERRIHKLMRFGETETDGGRDILRAAEVTSDPLLRRLYLVHAIDELRHGAMFRERAASLLGALHSSSKPVKGSARDIPAEPVSGWQCLLARFARLGPLCRSSQREQNSHNEPHSGPLFRTDWLAPGGHGVDDLEVDGGSDHEMLAFLHLSEKAAASRFTVYRDVLRDDPPTYAVFDEILHDETFHMNYTLTQLARISPQDHGRHIWRARLSRLWKAYLRVASALASVIGTLLMTVQYFVLMPPFAWLAKRAARRERTGWTAAAPDAGDSLTRQY